LLPRVDLAAGAFPPPPPGARMGRMGCMRLLKVAVHVLNWWYHAIETPTHPHRRGGPNASSEAPSLRAHPVWERCWLHKESLQSLVGLACSLQQQ
jgi:hypothetical protein